MKKPTTKAPGLEGVQHVWRTGLRRHPDAELFPACWGKAGGKLKVGSMDQWTKKQVWKIMANTANTINHAQPALGHLDDVFSRPTWGLNHRNQLATMAKQIRLMVTGTGTDPQAKHIPWFLLVPGDTQIWPCPACSLFNLAGWRLQVGPQSGTGQDLRNFFFLGDEHPQLAAPTWRETHTFQGELIQRCIHPAVRLMWWACVAYRHNPLLLLHYPLHVRIWYISYLIFVEIHSCRLMDRWMNGWIDRP